ncbi:fucolectin-1-like [Mixophyes fleayi]|uniref:fucolectin-1-like n=1 Tax=Mixophyes fleayi TaxID=3061075 RepID=UPI003F4D9A90
MTGRYVNINLPQKGTYLQLCEVQVYVEVGFQNIFSPIRRMMFLLSAALLLLFSSTTAHYNVKYENVALQGRATQSSTYSYQNTIYNAIKAIDGDTNSDFGHGSCSSTTNEASPWWRVDLLKSYKISHITITKRGDCCGERIDGASILIGDSLAYNGNYNPRCSSVQFKRQAIEETYQCNGMAGRYVNIYLQQNNFLQLCEVQVFVATEPEYPV